MTGITHNVQRIISQLKVNRAGQLKHFSVFQVIILVISTSSPAAASRCFSQKSFDKSSVLAQHKMADDAVEHLAAKQPDVKSWWRPKQN